MNLEEFTNLIEKYKRGECSSRETEFLENYLESFQNNSYEWKENEMGNKIIAEGKIYSEIMKNIDNQKNHYVRGIIFSPTLLKRAASIIFFLILGSAILYVSGIFPKKTDSVFWYEKATSYGEKDIITLTDGSIITLNADSKLKFPDQFDGSRREIYLEGEAYFEVHHNINQPFIVHTENLSTIVLGTKFNVSAYPENKTIAVSLLEGKVKILRSEKDKVDKIVFLKPKEQLEYDKENDVGSIGLFDSLKAVGWKDNIYKFENEPLHNVLSQIEKAFGVKFKVTSQSVLAQRITIKLEKGSLQTAVEVIKSLTGLDYKIVKGNNNLKEVLLFRNTK